MGEIPFNYLELRNEAIENKVDMQHAAKVHVTAVHEMSGAVAEPGWGFLGPHTPRRLDCTLVHVTSGSWPQLLM